MDRFLGLRLGLFLSGLILLFFFQNCSESRLVLPSGTSSGDAVIRADLASLTDIDAFVSDKITIEPQITGNFSDQSELSYRWYKEGNFIPSATDLNFTIDAQSIEDEGFYTLEVLDDGEILSSATFEVRLSHHKSCLEILNADSSKSDGLYEVDVDGNGANLPQKVYCDMTTDTGGWTLVARILANSANHDTGEAIGTVEAPDQLTTGKLSDASINLFSFTHVRMNIENTLNVYFQTDSVDLTGDTNFSLVNQAAESFAGPYDLTYTTSVSCDTDCGVATILQTSANGRYCGYQYHINGGNPATGMGCEDTGGNLPGQVWIR